MSSPSPNVDSASSSPNVDSSAQSQQDSTQSTLQQLFGGLCKQKLLEEVDKLKEAVQKDDPQKVIMSLPMLLALTVCPAMLGTQEAIRQSQAKTKREEHRGRRCNLVVSCVKPSIRSRDINNKLVVLKDSKLYIANEHPLYNHDPKNNVSKGYAFSGYFLPFPDTEYEGLVTTISDDPPFLNWIYIDKKTYEVKYGVRADTEGHITGPFDCTKQDRRMTCEGWEGFCAVEELPGIWALYYDRDDDGLKSKVAMGTRVLEVELTRREKKEPKPAGEPEQPMTMDEKMKQHKEQTAKDEADRAAFVATGRHPGAEPPSPAHKSEQKKNGLLDPDSKEAKRQRIADALSRLNIDSPTKSEGGSDGSILTSLSQDFSIFSMAKKLTGDEGGTVASSVWEPEKEKDKNHKKNGSTSEAGSYKKPTVEDATS
ncbi:hypothetical protein H9Q69_001868 [Fusarium xylarioides]|uniref:Uncharacterized protein n=1 Tax=Fusarium xylarioides TaxID=221167 RepID=A0A9P7HU05_9HYPO|nr:hypothetical protein H9Q70_001455 [Fusarium xylarioides]KAG5763597.1 hypothetical protein H9Q72_008328 [Fusarium xylarioides]KAG5785283.1 hypothetical protein H9Q73_001056 [Fusarium xylarioides]KAG5799140.1 hypothetical protein H9Q69_001868 [Fusarium xylarioides]KAG5828528.1 hypothetical protein H9Q74_001367 [Fusarium xylarioides]